MIRAVLPLSFVVHVAVLLVLPDAPTSGAPRTPLAIVELASEPLPAPPAPLPPAPLLPAPREPMPKAEVARRPTSATAVSLPTAATARAPANALADDPPLDLTAMTVSNALASPNASPGAVAAGSSTFARPAAPRVAPRFVLAAALAKPPRAPGLDAVLEANYPPAARRAGVSGKAELRVRILSDGRVAGVERIAESYPGFGEACERTVRAARWEAPIDAEGRAVETEIRYVCRFEVGSG